MTSSSSLRKNGHYTASEANPVGGLFILSKAERKAKSEPYQPFSTVDLRRFFEPAAYKTGMAEPDFFWCPLLGIYTGMRISEATAIRCGDVRQADNGIYFIFVPKSKTSAGIRSVPICRALVQLGFLDFVALQRAGGHDRLFPDRLFINHSYSKKLSERMKVYLVERGIKQNGDHKSFHSFRVNVITQLANNGVNTAMSMKIVGHKSRDGDDVHMGYVRDLPAMKEAVDALAWPIEIAALAKPYQSVGERVAARQAEQKTQIDGTERIDQEPDARDSREQHLLKLAARLRASDEIRALVRSMIAVEGLDQWRLWATRVADDMDPRLLTAREITGVPP